MFSSKDPKLSSSMPTNKTCTKNSQQIYLTFISFFAFQVKWVGTLH